MKYQKRYKPKTKFEKFLKVYFIIGILVIVFTGVYAGVKSMQRKKEAASETIIHTVCVKNVMIADIVHVYMRVFMGILRMNIGIKNNFYRKIVSSLNMAYYR